MNTTMNYKPYIQPQFLSNEKGEVRRVGYELEFAGLKMTQVAHILAEQLDAEIEPKTEAECLVISKTLGKFKVELDWQFAKTTAAERASQRAEELNDKQADDVFMHWLTELARQIVPIEIVCPPIAIDQLHLLEPAVTELTKAGALGTEESLLYAFGVHINPELPDISAETIVRYLQAYCVAQDWLVKAHNVDPIRRVTPYINLYPDDYIRLVLDYSDSISLEQVMDDYLEHNPTRNRALDCLPLFKFINKDKIANHIDDDRVNARPTFHYRMPNCEIEQVDWSLKQSWHIWCVLETLAAQPELLTQLKQQWFEYDDSLINFKQAPWHSQLDQIKQNLLSE